MFFMTEESAPTPFKYRGDTLWGDRWKPTHRKDGLCSRCGGERDLVMTKSSYCQGCRLEYGRRYREKKRGQAQTA